VTYTAFQPPVTLREYGYDDGGLIRQTASGSGFLLPWDAINAEADAVSRREPCRYVVVGETLRADGARFPELGVTSAWLRHRGYVRLEALHSWHRPSEDCDKQKHDHR
jgi:hypothetical protein